MLYRYIVFMHSNTSVFYIRIEILLTDINNITYAVHSKNNSCIR